MRRVVLLPLLAAFVAVAAAALPAPALATSRAACSAPPPGMMRCFAQVLTPSRLHRAFAATPFSLPGGYGPLQFHGAYSLPKDTPLVPGTLKTRKKQTIAIVDAYSSPTAFADLTQFDATFGLPVFPRCTGKIKAACYQVMNQNGGTKLPASGVPSGWDVEISLDVQVAHEICQNCKILLVEATSPSFGDMGAAVNTAVAQGANVVSNSYGSYGSGSSLAGSHSNPYNHPNHAIVVSAGDSGFGPAFPADLNTVVAVGGTNLQLGAGNTYGGETTWNNSATSATGSGCDDASPARTWQTAVSTWAAIGCGPHRGMNDVSADADPNTGAAVYDSGGGFGWIQVGGTSLAAPLIAGVYGLAANSGTVSYPASLPYAHATSLRDVTSGSNMPGTDGFACASTPQCNATAGYDLPTGLGSPNRLAGF
jgi:subtilase family serine protease